MTEMGEKFYIQIDEITWSEICHTLTDPSQLAEACRNKTIDFSTVTDITLYDNWFN